MNRRDSLKDKNKIYQSFALVMQFGINMIVPIMLCTLAGVWIGNKVGKDYIVIPLFFVGVIAGFQNVYRMAKKVYEDDKPKNKIKKSEGINVKKDK